MMGNISLNIIWSYMPFNFNSDLSCTAGGIMRVESVVSERTKETSPISAPRSSPTDELEGHSPAGFNPDMLQQAEALKR